MPGSGGPFYGKAFYKTYDPNAPSEARINWKRVGMVIAGTGLLIVAAVMLLKK